MDAPGHCASHPRHRPARGPRGLADRSRDAASPSPTASTPNSQLDAGLFFIAFTHDAARFIAFQRRLGTHDPLNEYITHTWSAVFAVPAGVPRGGYVAHSLLA